MSLTKVTYSMISDASANVVDFGADPTGVAPSRDAIIAALTSLKATGGSVYFPPGTYAVSTSISLDATWTKPITLYADKGTATIQYGGALSDSVFILYDVDVSCLGLNIVGNYPPSAGGGFFGQSAFNINYTNLTVRDCEISFVYQNGISALNSIVVADSNYIHDNGNEGILLSIGCHDSSVTNNIFYQNKWHLDINGYNITVSGNKFLQTWDVYQTWGVTIERNGADWKVENIVVDGNIFENTWDIGLNVSGSASTNPPSNIVISNNVMNINQDNTSHFGTAFTLSNCENITIIGNEIRNCATDTGSLVDAAVVEVIGYLRNLVIDANHCMTAQHFLEFRSGYSIDAANINVTNNLVGGVTYGVMFASDSGTIDGIVVDGNTFVTAENVYYFRGLVTPTGSWFMENTLKNITGAEADGLNIPSANIRHRTAANVVCVGGFTIATSTSHY